MQTAPKGFVPWLFPVKANRKDPDGIAIAKRTPKDFKGKKGSWKADHARLTKQEAIERLKQGDNIGIAGREGDVLVIYDKDDKSVKDKVATLTTKSRTGIGGHGFCFRNKEDKSLDVNIPTNQKGEVRSCDQYVVCAGSFVPVGENEACINDGKLGLYAVQNSVAPATITLNDLPDVFLEQIKKNQENIKRIKELPKTQFDPKKSKGKTSALFELTIENVVGHYASSERFEHPLHGSEKTGSNFSVGDGVAHCWRCLVSLNALQFLTVKSGFMSCDEAGTGHKGKKPSMIVGNNGAIFHAWRQAKQDGVIPIEDKIPVKAMQYIAQEHKLVKPNFNFDEKLPIKIYNKILQIVKEEY